MTFVGVTGFHSDLPGGGGHGSAELLRFLWRSQNVRLSVSAFKTGVLTCTGCCKEEELYTLLSRYRSRLTGFLIPRVFKKLLQSDVCRETLLQ